MGKKSWNDLATLFNQKASLYSDPNFQTCSNYDNSGAEGQGFQQTYGDSDYNLCSSNNFSSKETSFLLNSSKLSDTSESGLLGSSASKSGLSKEEATLLNFGNKLSRSESSKKSKVKTKEDDFWDILNDPVPSKRN